MVALKVSNFIQKKFDEKRNVGINEKVEGWTLLEMEEKFQKAFAIADLDSNEKIDYEEFKRCVKK